MKSAQNKATKPQKQKKTKDGRRKENAIVRYFRQTWVELRKTTWPSRSEGAKLTGIVLAVTVAMSLLLGLIDWLFSLLFSFLVKSSG
ncbi:MAG: preprotein translocase subunit SecE [Anaerolineae bacterium]|nr:preprotein translocase subunit SecE [Anaerolineae bacterium]